MLALPGHTGASKLNAAPSLPNPAIDTMMEVLTELGHFDFAIFHFSIAEVSV